ncbi:MAG: aryl-sulfate sulfotransferase [Marmoricola sp.]
MLRSLVAALVASCLTVWVTPALPAQAVPAAPTHTLQVSGTDLGMYPAFDPGVERYALTTSATTGGTVEVIATTNDPDGTVLVDGRPAPGGRASVSGLTEGDEISVVFRDAGGDEIHSLVYLPAQFPRLSEVVPAASGVAPGHLLVTLSRYAADSPNFEAALDRHGVPAYVRSYASTSGVADLKSAGAPGHFTTYRGPTPTSGRTGGQVVELDDQFREVRAFETKNLVNTDAHDSVVRADGSRILLAYEPNAVSGLSDAVIQEVNAVGDEVYTWNSADHLDPAAETTMTPGVPDYAHVNSIHVMADGDLLVSFRHLSAVYKIAWRAHDGFSRGDVVWRLGGRHSSFSFEHDPFPSGPCAQHSATELPNGHVVVFDNGSVALGSDPALCVDPDDPEGATISRRQTRVTEYALDPAAHVADLVWSYQPTGKFTFFAGSARRLANGNTLVGWAADTSALATEVDPSGAPSWELKNDDGFLSYRTALAVVPDTVRPRLEVSTPAPNASYAYGQVVTPDFTCTDRGGSSLHSCQGPRTLPTRSPGRHTFTARATDGDGNTSTISRSYTVAQPPPAYRVDGVVRRAGAGWVGNNVYGSYLRQRVTQTVRRDGATATSSVRVQNEGNRPDTISVRGTGGTSRFSVTYYAGRTNVTARVRAGTWRPTLAAGRYVDLRLVVKRLGPASPGHLVQAVVSMVSGGNSRARDAVASVVRATR